MADAMDRNFFLADFAKAVRLAKPQFDAKRIDFKECVDHEIATLPNGRSYVYVFWMPDGDRYLKIGKAGPNSQPRIYQHYSVDNAKSTLARSIRDNPDGIGLSATPEDPRQWIREHTRLFLFIMPDGDRFPRNFLEAYLHLRFNPVYEKG
jgi:hypothetical protein